MASASQQGISTVKKDQYKAHAWHECLRKGHGQHSLAQQKAHEAVRRAACWKLPGAALKRQAREIRTRALARMQVRGTGTFWRMFRGNRTAARVNYS